MGLGFGLGFRVRVRVRVRVAYAHVRAARAGPAGKRRAAVPLAPRASQGARPVAPSLSAASGAH